MLKLLRALFLTVISLAINLPIMADTHEDAIAVAVNNPARSDSDRERDASSKPEEVLKFFDVQPGMKVLDLFSGGGYYSEILSYAVGPEGQVIAHTNKLYEGFTGEEASNRFAENRLANVSRVTSEIDDLGLEKASLDMILLVLAYHDIYYVGETWPKVDRDNFFQQIRTSLKPGGTLAIVDHSAIVGSGISAAQELHRIDEVFAKKDIERAGFVFEGRSDVLRNANDTRRVSVFDDTARRKTDRFVYRFTFPKDED